MIRKTCLSAAIVLSGCAAPAPRPDPNALTELIAVTYSGKPVDVMMAKYGAPIRQLPVGADTVYSWERQRVMYYPGQPPSPVHCQMDAYVHNNGIVWKVGLTGQNDACPMFE
jgi:hypothetical protein